MKILHTEANRYASADRARLDEVAEVAYIGCPTQRELVAELGRRPYDALFVRIGLAVDRAALEACPTLRWVVTPTTGLDHLDLGELDARGISLISLKGQIDLLDTVAATAELTWGLLLALIRRIPSAFASVRAGAWSRDDFLGWELRGRTLGVVGHGRLGKMVARYGLAFGMQVLAFDRDPAAATATDGVVPVALDELLAAADVVSLHLPLDDTTRGFMTADRLARMKPGAVLVNTARGELVDEEAVIEALRRGHLGGVATDVVADDSRWPGVVPHGQPFVALAETGADVVITPHIGGYARDAIGATRAFVTDQFVHSVMSTGEVP